MSRKGYGIIYMMLRIFLILLSFFITTNVALSKCYKDMVKIGIIDTGFGYIGKGYGAKLCRFGHKDFTDTQLYTHEFDTITAVPVDNHGHGTNIEGLIEKYANNSSVDYCIVIIKFYNTSNDNSNHVESIEKSMQYISNINLDIVNFSGGGSMPLKNEAYYVKKFLDRGGILVAAAGNDGLDLDHSEKKFYPALYDRRIKVVGNLNKNGTRYYNSNYGSMVRIWEPGEDMTAYGITSTGTSQATAVATGKLIRSLKQCKKDE